MRHDMENCDETLTLWGERERENSGMGGEREREREREVWDFKFGDLGERMREPLGCGMRFIYKIMYCILQNCHTPQ